MRAILIPVKEFAEAKKRLASHFSLEDRAALARALCQDFFRMIAGVRGVDRIFVVSKEPEVLAAAESAGWSAIVESHQSSESASVDFASRHCAAMGVTALLRVPIDIPLAEPRDIQALFNGLNGAPEAVIVPSGDGTGTNALLRTPPTAFPSRFGPGSFSLHLAEAEAAGVPARVMRNARIEHDLDELDDLRRIAPFVPARGATARWFQDRAEYFGAAPHIRAASASLP